MKLKYYLGLLTKASKLDIFDAVYEFSSESLNTLSLAGYWEKINGAPKRGVLVRIGIFFWHFYKSFFEYWHRKDTTLLSGASIFFAMSKNEIDSLKPVYVQMPNAYLSGSNETPFPFPFVWAYALSCIYLPLVLFKFLKSKGYKRKSFGFVFDHYWLVYGLYIAARVWFDRYKPRSFVLANQINTYHRVLQMAASDEHIPTFYLQHASTPENFPPLESDYALLEGYDALSKLADAGTKKPLVFLIGMPKHDAYVQFINTQSKVTAVGICTNDMDPLPRTEQLLLRIRQEFPTLPLILRPHNADLRVKEWIALARKYAVEFSDSKSELSFDFLRRVGAIVAGDSNILLEASLINVVPLYYDFALAHLDWYGFQRNGLVEYFSEPSQVIDCIRGISVNKPSVRMKARRYCATLGTRHDGHSSELAATLIQSLSFSLRVEKSIWKRIPNIGLEAYDLDDNGESNLMDRNLW